MTAGRHETHRGRGVLKGALTALAVGATATVGLAACTGSPAPSTPTPVDPDPSSVVSALGAVPIPPSSAPVPTPRASAGHPAMSAAGGPVDVSFGPKSRALVTMLGPEQTDQGAGGAAGAGPEKSTRAVLTLQVAQITGGTTIRAEELSSRDETGRRVELHSSGAATVTTHEGHTSRLPVLGTFDSGSAQVTWRHHGQVLAVWTFTIELD